MNTLELKNILIHKISEINDMTFLKAIKTIIDTKTETQIIALSKEQKNEINESKKQIKSGLFSSQQEMDEEFNLWLGK